MNHNCGNCRFSQRDREGQLWCHRYPPTVSGWRQVDSENAYLRCTWPQLDDDDWCGEWKRTAEAEQALQDALKEIGY